MDVDMRHFEAQNNHRNSRTACYGADPGRDSLRKNHHRPERFVVEVENVIEFASGFTYTSSYTYTYTYTSSSTFTCTDAVAIAMIITTVTTIVTATIAR